MIQLILSLDYELFGNGAGDVMRDVIHPTDRLLDICDRHGAKLTIMFEVGEYWAFERYDRQLCHERGYSPYEAMKTQAINAIERGHDVQLHLHPQWIGAVHDRGVWELRNAYWRLADLPGGLGNKDEIMSITGALHAGKQTLEDMIRPVKAEYECICFRAGGFYAQPSHKVIPAMKEAGLKVDSSVVRGYRRTTPFDVDYSNVQTDNGSWWTTDTELVAEGTPGENILELPVACRMEPYWNNFKPVAFRAAMQRRRMEKASGNGKAHGNGSPISCIPSVGTFLRRMMAKYASQLDYCKLSCREMLTRLKELDSPGENPVVMIGHTKDFINDRHCDAFLAAVSHSESVRFVTMSESVRERVNSAGASRTPQTMDAGHRA